MVEIPKKVIAIVGAGSAGMAIAQSLSKSIDPEKFDLVIISERSYYIHLPGALRLVTTSEGKLEDQVFIPYDKAFKAGKAGRYIFKKVKAIERNAIKFETEEGEEEGHSMRYDWLVVCNGSRWEGPLDFPPTLQEAKEFVGDWRRRIGTARNIVIAGGGAVGCELAGEIAHFHPAKKVTIVHSQSGLLNPTYTQSFRIETARQLVAGGVDLLFNDTITDTGITPGFVTTSKGMEIKCDLVIPARGAKPNTEIICALDPTAVNREGYVKVRPSLQVELASGSKKVYAAGDIIAWKEQKQLVKANNHATVISANLVQAIQKFETKQEYTTGGELILLTNGPYGGVSQLPIFGGITIGAWFTSLVKGRWLFTYFVRKQLGY